MPTLKTITGTFTGPDGVPVPCQVKAVLSQPCTVPGTQEVIDKATRVFSDPVTAAFSLPLYANNDLTPTNTYYTVTAVGMVDSAPVVGTWVIVVPQSAGPFEISTILALTPPVPQPPGALDAQVVHLALPETITGVKVLANGLQIGTNNTIWMPPPSGGDDSAVIQAAWDAIHGTVTGKGSCIFQAGTYLAKNLVLYGGIRYAGLGPGGTTLKLPNGSNTHLISSLNYAALIGTNSGAGEQDFDLRGLTLDGNRANNSSGDVLRIYGCNFRLEDFVITGAAGVGLRSEWSATAGVPGTGVKSLVSSFKVKDCGQEGVIIRGPHDMTLNKGVVSLNSQASSGTYDGLVTQSSAGVYSAAGIILDDVHVWGTSHRIPINLGDATVVSDTCEYEGAQTASLRFIGTQSYIGGWCYAPGGGATDGIQVGDGSSGPSNYVINAKVQNMTGNALNFLTDNGTGDITLNVGQASGATIAGTRSSTTKISVVKQGGASGVSEHSFPGQVTGTASGKLNLLLGDSGTSSAISSEVPVSLFQGGKVLVHAGFANQRFWRFDRPTITADQAGQTITSAATVYIAGNPLTDASGGFTPTITGAYALWVQNGSARLDVGIGINAGPAATGNINVADGALISAAFATSVTFKSTAPGLLANNGLQVTGELVGATGTNFNLLLGTTGTSAVQSAELSDVVAQGGKLLVHAGFATQRFVRFDRPTITADQAGQTITSAATVTIVGNVQTDASGGFAPTVTLSYSLWVQQGSVRLDAGVGINASPGATGNINFADGGVLAAAFQAAITLNNAAPSVTLNNGVSITDAKDMVLGTGTGTKFGTATNQKLAFHNSTPVIQRAGAAQAAAASTASTSTTPFGYTTAAQADAIVTLVNELRAAMVEKGLIKGAA